MEYIVLQESRGMPFFIYPSALAVLGFAPNTDRALFLDHKSGRCLHLTPSTGGHIWVFETLSQALAHVEARREADRKPNRK